METGKSNVSKFTDKLGNLAANAIYGPAIFTLKPNICNVYMSIQHHGMMASLPLFIRYLYIL